MTTHEILLASILLKTAADEFGNHGCNDMDLKIFDDMNPAEVRHMADRFNQWNVGNIMSRDDPDYTPYDRIPDSSWMSYLAFKLKEFAK